jgi:hypothetical protein
MLPAAPRGVPESASISPQSSYFTACSDYPIGAHKAGVAYSLGNRMTNGVEFPILKAACRVWEGKRLKGPTYPHWAEEPMID